MSKNVLFIGPYRQGNDGWCIASRHYINALKESGVNLTIRPIYMGQGRSEPPLDFLELEENKLPYYDVVIQNVLPHLLDYNAKFGKNIALVYTETRNWQNVWASRLSMMDAIWTPSVSDIFNLSESGVDNKVSYHRIPIPADVSKFSQSYQSESLKELEAYNDSFKFYFIGEFIQRKCVDKLVQAFHTEFDYHEDVELVIKASKAGMHSEQLAKMLNEYLTKIKSLLRVYSSPQAYKQELCITSQLTESDMNYLHSKCDCFVMPSMGESWSMPVMDALGFGKTPIVIQDTGPSDIVNSSNGYVVPSYLERVVVTDPPMPDMYTGRELWHSFSIYELGKAMRKAYEERNDKTKQEAGMEKVYELSYEKVGKLIAGIL